MVKEKLELKQILREKEYKNIMKELDTELTESLKLLKSLFDIKLKKQKQWDFLLCQEVWVHKIIINGIIVFVTEEDFNKLKLLGFECYTIG